MEVDGNYYIIAEPVSFVYDMAATQEQAIKLVNSLNEEYSADFTKESE
jgi:hypothetical protein